MRTATIHFPIIESAHRLSHLYDNYYCPTNALISLYTYIIACLLKRSVSLLPPSFRTAQFDFGRKTGRFRSENLAIIKNCHNYRPILHQMRDFVRVSECQIGQIRTKLAVRANCAALPPSPPVPVYRQVPACVDMASWTHRYRHHRQPHQPQSLWQADLR